VPCSRTDLGAKRHVAHPSVVVLMARGGADERSSGVGCDATEISVVQIGTAYSVDASC
jgi:hypothetical protein